MKDKGIDKINVRFFVYEKEVHEQDFLEAHGNIEYTRHSVFENGVRQICLTKNPY